MDGEPDRAAADGRRAVLTFVVQCPDCHGTIARVDVDGDDWHEAELWAYVAAAEHRSICPAGDQLAIQEATL